MTPACPALRVAVILVNWNGCSDCIECLSSLFGSGGGQFDVYLVDNDSSDGSVEQIVAWCKRPLPQPGFAPLPKVNHLPDCDEPVPVRCKVVDAGVLPAPEPNDCELTVVRSGGNLGFAGGNNVGIRAAGLQNYEYFWLLNTDTVVRPDTLPALLERAAESGIGMVGSTLVDYGSPQRVQALGGGQLDARTLRTSHIGAELPVSAVPASEREVAAVEQRMTYVVGASMLVTCEFIREVGPMCEDYFLYFEEIDWALRAAGRFRLGYAPNSVVYHKGGASSTKVVSEFSERLFCRNRVRFIGRFFPERVWPALANMALEVLRHLARGRFTRARLLFGALFNARKLLRS